MSAEDATRAAGEGQGEPSEEEIRAAYEAELSRISATDMIAQAAVSLLNIGARRLGPPSGDGDPEQVAGRDLEQARDAIDAVKALLDILERSIPQELGPLRDALSRLQMAYAREIPAGRAGEQRRREQRRRRRRRRLGAASPRRVAGPARGAPARAGAGRVQRPPVGAGTLTRRRRAGAARTRTAGTIDCARVCTG